MGTYGTQLTALKELPASPGEVSHALQQLEVIFLAGKEPPTAQRLRLCPKEEVITNLFIFPEQDLPPGPAGPKQALSLPESGWGSSSSSLESRWAGRLWGSEERRGTTLAWELRRWTPSTAFSVAGLLVTVATAPSTYPAPP